VSAPAPSVRMVQMNRRRLLATAVWFPAALAGACSRLPGQGGAAPQAAAPEPTPSAPPSPEPSPPPSPDPTPAPTPEPSPTPPPPGTPRLVNGLQVVDEVWVGVVREAGGLRIRSAPRVEAGNVVGSVATGTRINVEGRVLNGQEAEPGRGTVWLIVGQNQYMYAPEGYVERLR
jgi:hypothetical protein